MTEQSAVKIDDLEESLLFVSTGDLLDNQAWVCRDTGEVFWHCDEIEDFGPVPEDIDDGDRYAAIPDKRDLGLGKPLALEFARTHLPEHFEHVRDIFSRRGAYARFKDLLAHNDSLEAWYQGETEKTRQALREWCEDNSIKLAE